MSRLSVLALLFALACSPDGTSDKDVTDTDATDIEVPCTDADNDGVCEADDCDDDPAECGADCFPGNTAADICDGFDNDCDDSVDEEPELRWFLDEDADGFGGTTEVTACEAPLNHVADGGDCNDDASAGADIHPDATESCDDSIDNNCNERTDCEDTACSEEASCEACVDEDADGWFAPEGCPGGSDCDDDPEDCGNDCYPGNTAGDTCANADGFDNDCDTEIDEEGAPTWFYDRDRDGVGIDSDTLTVCEQPDNYVDIDGDCAPLDEHHWADCGLCVDPDEDGYGEQCDLGEDCDEGNPALFVPRTLFVDADRDGHGSTTTADVCTASIWPVGMSDIPDDCDDAQILAFPGAIEIPGDGIDNDCGGDGDDPIDNDHVIYVSPDGDDSDAGTAEAPLRTITDALVAARAAGKAIALEEGTYDDLSLSVVEFDVAILGGFTRDESDVWEHDPSQHTSRINLQVGRTDNDEPAAMWGVELVNTTLTPNNTFTTRANTILRDVTLRAVVPWAGSHSGLTVMAFQIGIPQTTVLMDSTIETVGSSGTNATVVGAQVLYSAHLAIVRSSITANDCPLGLTCAQTSIGVDADWNDGRPTSLFVTDSIIRSSDTRFTRGIDVDEDASAEIVRSTVESVGTSRGQQAFGIDSDSAFLTIRDSVMAAAVGSGRSYGLRAESAHVVNSYAYAGDSPISSGVLINGTADLVHVWAESGEGERTKGFDIEGTAHIANSVGIAHESTLFGWGLYAATGSDITVTGAFLDGHTCPLQSNTAFLCYDTVPAIEACSFAECQSISGVVLGDAAGTFNSTSGATDLNVGSVCIDAASDLTGLFPDVNLNNDFYGLMRPVGGVADLGPMEVQP